MSEETKNFIDKLAIGDNVNGLVKRLKMVSRVKVGNTLDQIRKDMVGNLFNGNIEGWNIIVIQIQIVGSGTFTKDGQVVDTTNVKRWSRTKYRFITMKMVH